MNKIISLFLLLKLSLAFGLNYTGCDFYQQLKPGNFYRLYSKGFYSGAVADKNTKCRYAAEAPYGYKIAVSCRFSLLLPIPKCQNSLKISITGRTDFADATLYCGFLGLFSTKSSSNRMTIEFLTGNSPIGGNFLCSLTLIQDTCECGRRNVGRIVGGNETLTNEFPLMAAIMLGNTDVWCGATIISNKAAVSAAHCFDGMTNATRMRLVVGEHNISSSTETRFTRSYDIKNITVHEKYDSSIISENDIALVFTRSIISFDNGVSPSCLPFRFESYSFSGDDVIGLGWGTTESAGPTSNVLQKVQLTAMSDFICTDNLLCVSAFEKDLCQYDSGGPILYLNPNNSLLYNIAIISSGVGCGTSQYSTNVRVTAYLDWILEKTMTTVYCVK